MTFWLSCYKNTSCSKQPIDLIAYATIHSVWGPALLKINASLNFYKLFISASSKKSVNKRDKSLV